VAQITEPPERAAIEPPGNRRSWQDGPRRRCARRGRRRQVGRPRGDAGPNVRRRISRRSRRSSGVVRQGEPGSAYRADQQGAGERRPRTCSAEPQVDFGWHDQGKGQGSRSTTYSRAARASDPRPGGAALARPASFFKRLQATRRQHGVGVADSFGRRFGVADVDTSCRKSDSAVRRRALGDDRGGTSRYQSIQHVRRQRSVEVPAAHRSHMLARLGKRRTDSPIRALTRRGVRTASISILPIDGTHTASSA